jgi:hypothetical protein
MRQSCLAPAIGGEQIGKTGNMRVNMRVHGAQEGLTYTMKLPGRSVDKAILVVTDISGLVVDETFERRRATA